MAIEYRTHGKRLFDVIATAVLCVAAAPLLLAVAWLVRVRLGRPVLFAQWRPGLNGRLFRLYKFRTMTDARDTAGQLLPDADRLTPFGRWLRSTSLDELPELWNVLRGDMSLVGPRPLLREYLDRFTPQQARRHEVRPGLTGRAQVNGRNQLSWDEKFAHDIAYVDNLSVWGDVKILAATPLRVLRRDAISAQAHATMPVFVGIAPQAPAVAAAGRAHAAAGDSGHGQSKSR